MFSKTRIRFRKPVIHSMLSTLLLLCAISKLEASQMEYLEVEDLTRMSTHVFRGDVLSADVVWTPDHNSIQTVVRVKVNESFKGTLSAGQVITIRQIGGEIDGRKLDYEGRPIFVAGEPVVLFTTEMNNGTYVVMALKQGKMKLEGDMIVRDFSGLSLVAKGSRPGDTKVVTSPKTRISLSELRTRIARVK